MRRILSFCASSLLATGMLMAQTSSAPSAPPAQDNNAAQSTDTAKKPNDPGAARNADAGQNGKAARGNNAAQTIDQNTKKPDGTAGATGTSNSDADMSKDKAGTPNGDAVRPESADAANQNATNAPQQSRAGVPWLWIVLGAIALIAILSLLGGRGPDRVERVDRVTTIDRDRRIDDRVDDRIDRHDDDIRRVG
jgi:cobalamin biosynthesis Mg chelatase CobN